MTKSYKRKWLHKGGIIRQRGDRFQVEINVNSKRIRKTFGTRDESERFIEQTRTELCNAGLDSQTLTSDQRADASLALKSLPPNMTLNDAVKHYAQAASKLAGSPLAAAVDFYLLHHKPVGGVKTVSELLTDYLASKRKLGRRARTLSDIQCRMGQFAKEFGNTHVHALRPENIDTWLDDHHYTGQSRINYCRVLSGFFSYARKLRLIESNPADRDHIDRPKLDERLPAVFPVASVECLMATALSKAPKITPYLAIGFFAGLRTTELDGLDWANIHIDQKLITIKPEIAKRRRQRHVDMSDNLIAWLQPYHKGTGPLRVKGLRKLMDRVIKKSKVKWVHNGMRHTFASNHLEKTRDSSKTMLQLGHIGRVDVLFNHYRNLVTPVDCARYWKIVPPTQPANAKQSGAATLPNDHPAT